MSCYFWPVFGAADFPWFHGGPVDQLRPAQGTNMYLEAWSWLRSHYPYWDRHGGEDHIVVSMIYSLYSHTSQFHFKFLWC